MKSKILQFIKLHWPKITSIFLFILLSLAYANIFAVFTPGETLDPNCAPGTVGCTVNVSSTETDPVWSVDKPSYSTKAVADTLYKLAGYTPDLSAYSTKSVADTLYLGINSVATNSSSLEGHSASYFQTALGYTPYNATNPNGYITGITSLNVTTALGFTPYNSTNPNGYISSYTETDPTISAWAKAGVKPSYSYSEISSTPTLLSQFTNDLGNYGGFVTGTPWTSMGYLTSYTETDPTISAWAKAATKPTYTAAEVGAPSGSGNSTGTNTGDNAVNSLYSGLTASKQDTLNGTGFVKSTAGTISYDTNTYLTSINSGNVTTALGYTPYNATNPAGYISSYTETDPTISAWAKAVTKPTYTASEVGLGNVPNLSFSGSNTGDETTSSIKTKLGQANTTTDGYISSVDWNTFNNKQPAGSYLTSYTETDPTVSAWAKAGVKPSYSYSEISSTPTLLSQFTNDLGNYGGFVTGTPWTSMGYVTGTPWTSMGYLTSYTETDPTISAWAKALVKPTYTASEVGLGNVTNESKATMFTNPTLTGTTNIANVSITGSIIPTVDNFYYLGSPAFRWHSLYVGPGSIYVNGQKVLQTDMSNSVVMSADDAQNVIVKTTGGGNIELNPASGGGGILLKSNVTLTAGKSFRTSDLTPVVFSDGTKSGNINIIGNTISSGNTNGDIEFAPNGAGRTYVSSGNFGIGNTAPGEKLSVTGNILATGTILGSNISGNTSGTNTGDNAVNSLYSGLASSKQDVLSGTGFVKSTAGTISYDTNTYLTTASAGSTYIPYTGGTSNVDLGAHNLTVDTNTLFVDATNHKVGIGMTNPNYVLDIAGNGIQVTRSGSNPSVILSSTGYTGSAGDTVGSLAFRGNDNSASNVLFGSINGFDVVPTAGAVTGGINFKVPVAGTLTEIMRINGNNVGIGITNPFSPLSVVSGEQETATAFFHQNAPTNKPTYT